MVQATLNRVERIYGAPKPEHNHNEKVRRWALTDSLDLVVLTDVGGDKYADVFMTYSPEARNRLPFLKRGAADLRRHSGTKWRSMRAGAEVLWGRIDSYSRLDEFAAELLELTGLPRDR